MSPFLNRLTRPIRATQSPRTSIVEVPQYLGFRLAGHDYAFDLRHALAIRPFAQAEHKFKCSPWPHSMYDEQEQRYVPMLDLRAWLNPDPMPLAPNPPALLILIELAQCRLALPADTILDVLEMVSVALPDMRCRMRGALGVHTVQILDLMTLAELLLAGPDSRH